MITAFLLVIIILLFASNWMLWKTGSVAKAENPESVLDKPIMDEAEQKAIRKRLRRWRDEGKLNREEFETFYQLCKTEWD